MTTDPIADLLTTIRNAIAISRSEISVPYSSVKERILEQLKSTDYIDGFSVEEVGGHNRLKVVIFEPGDTPRITKLARVSKPGRRIYSKADQMPVIKNGRGVVLVSTSKGIMTGGEATKQRLGGEVLCEVY